MNNMQDSSSSEWLSIARKDWARIHLMLENDDLDAAAKYKPELETFRDLCERVSGYYFAERYPPLGELDLRSEDIKKGLIEAKKFVKAMFPSEKL